MTPGSFAGIEIISSPYVPESQHFALDDADDRFAAMTAHHIVLDLVPLTRLEFCVWEITAADGSKKLACNPKTFERLKPGDIIMQDGARA